MADNEFPRKPKPLDSSVRKHAPNVDGGSFLKDGKAPKLAGGCPIPKSGKP